VGHASRVTFLVERDVPLPIPELVARPIASARDRRRSWGSLTLRSVAPARQALDRCPIRLTHLPFSERRPDDFVGGSAVLYTVQIFASPTIVSDNRSRPFAAASGFLVPCGQSVPVGFLRPSRPRLPWASSSFRCAGAPCIGVAHAISKFRVGRQPPEIRFRLLSARELGFVTCFEMRLTDTCRDAFSRITGPALQRIDAADAWLIQFASS
jgi:hypothetical protein